MSLLPRRVGTVVLVLLGSVYAAWMGFGVQTMGDYPAMFAPAMNALLAGHIATFLAHLPAEGAGGSLLLRAPAALLGKLVVGGQLAIFRFGALFCVLALGILGVWLAREMRQAGHRSLGRAGVIGICVLSPALLDAVRFGHPEEALGAALCVGAMLLAAENRTVLAGLALGLAVINKPWGALAAIPVLVAAPGSRLQLATAAAAACGVWFASAYFADPAGLQMSLTGAGSAPVAHPVDLWWPFARLHTRPGVTLAYLSPTFLADHGRELSAIVGLLISFALVRRRARRADACLAMLALVFLVRCLLDPSNHVYYQLPLVISLAAWEVRSGKLPILALLATGGFWLVFHTISGIASLNVQFVAYLVVVLPLLWNLVGPAFGADKLAARSPLAPPGLSPA